MMKFDSKYFDRIRIRPTVTEPVGEPLCQWQGCKQCGGYRAPKGRLREGEYYNFCLDHVREYNKAYNYFSGMPDDEVDAYRRASATGHRPTWAMGTGGAMPHGAPRGRESAEAMRDVFGLFDGLGPQFEPAPKQRRPLHNLERKSFAVLNLEGSEDGAEIKARFKALVKRLHPDANGGDRGSEDKLREIIQAYNHLKAAGFC